MLIPEYSILTTFSCVFVLFQVMSWLFSIPLRTVNNTKTQENVSVCTGPNTNMVIKQNTGTHKTLAIFIRHHY